ncbi:hypothetical protein [Emticicia sp. C21]|uniref:hypothetical protein n=1 Tax=Emticicia sp. C21 TaxID=2302915 RepID=UPI000E3432BD|nr:hypothetical protein [Emticicia sp. C21]RFS16921.1 hypothetical protein D0T08_09600 [Emticicia sp. C21]
MNNENISTEQPLLLKYMTILFLLVSFLSILGLFLLSRIYWKDAPVSENAKVNVSPKQSLLALADTNFV